MTDIVERMAQAIAEAMNGGEFNDGKWYTEGQRQAWRKAVTPAADEIERLREGLQQIANNSCCGTCQEAALVAKRTLEGKDG